VPGRFASNQLHEHLKEGEVIAVADKGCSPAAAASLR
jgi:hypothetical protein